MQSGEDWTAAYAALQAADRTGGLAADELERLAVAAFLLGHDDEVVAVRRRAYQRYLDDGQVDRALRCGYWIGFHLQVRGEPAQAAGWLATLRRVAESGADPRWTTWLALPDAVAAMWSGAPEAALPVFDAAAREAAEAGEDDLFVLAGLGRGQCLSMLGRAAESRAALDETMLRVTDGGLQPQVAGLAYCVMISLCMDRFDLRRASEWTEALTDWTLAQQGLVPYRGVCMVHRAEISQLRGDWARAGEEAADACRRLARSREFAIGGAHYRVAELARLRGDAATAEAEYQRAAGFGYEVQPGLALLRMAQHRPDAAVAGLDRALAERASPALRAVTIAARIDVAVFCADGPAARRWLAELHAHVADLDGPYLTALAEHCTGTVLLAEAQPAEALGHLRSAVALWREIDAPYEAAQTCLAIGHCCRALGDADAARMETDAALALLRDLGAAPAAAAAAHPLSPRELEVLRLLATGATNRSIAGQLALSEKTVARHVGNIFGKLELGSRAAATAYAYEHGLT